MIRAYNFRSVDRIGGTRVSCRLDADGFPDEIFFDIRSEGLQAARISEPNWAIVSLLYPAMRSGLDLVIEADISQQLLCAVQGDLQGLLRACDPRLKEVNVISGLSTSPHARAKGVATGFSAGIDSFATLSLYSGNSVPESLKITCLTVHNVGAFGRGCLEHDDFIRSCARAKKFAGRMGLDSVFIDSNIDDVFRASTPPSYVFEHTHSFRNAAAAHVLHDSVGCFLYSSAHPFEEIGVAQLIRSSGKSTAHIDPILLPLLSTERMRLVSAGAALSRGRKTLLVSENELAATHLDVCVSPEARLQHGKANCSRCWKCERTMATLEAIGALDRFGAVFDVPHYHSNRDAVMKRLVWRVEQGSDIDLEVLQMLKLSGLRTPRLLPGYLRRVRSAVGRLRRRFQKLAP